MSSPKLTKGRHSEIGGFYAMTTIAHERARLFSDPGIARAVIGELERASDGVPFESYAWVLMPDHRHWLVELRRDDLSAGVQAFKSRSARAINLVRGSCGRTWQAGFYDHKLRNEADLRLQARYILENPVRSGLTLRLGEYPHCWCRWNVGDDDC